MACPGSEMVYNPIVQRCDSKENSVCPGDDLRGHIEENMIFGRFKARTHSIEFQKRVFPHLHLIMWLDSGTLISHPMRLTR